MFQIVLWGTGALLVLGLCVHWWRGEVRERRDAERATRWRKATVWNADASARVVRLSRVEPGRGWLDDGQAVIEISLPDGDTRLAAGWYLAVEGWIPAQKAVLAGRPVTLASENIHDMFPPDTPALHDRLMGKGERKGTFLSRLLGWRGM